MRVLTRYLREAGMQVLYERCAAVDVGKDVIAVAVRLPGGDGPDGRVDKSRQPPRRLSLTEQLGEQP